MSKKKVWTLCIAVAVLVCSVVVGTLAFLTDRDEVVNIFTVGNVAIKLDEAKVNPDGTVVEGADRVTANTYHLIPGATYVKDPTVTVLAGSETSYIRLLVTIDNMADLNSICDGNFTPENYVLGWNSAVWTYVGFTDNGDDTATYEFRYHTTVSTMDGNPLALEPLFTHIQVPGDISGEQLAMISNLTVKVEGHAIQAHSFADDQEAWEAFAEQYANP